MRTNTVLWITEPSLPFLPAHPPQAPLFKSLSPLLTRFPLVTSFPSLSVLTSPPFCPLLPRSLLPRALPAPHRSLSHTHTHTHTHTTKQRIAFSKNKSDAVSKKEGTYVPKEKRKRDVKEDGDSDEEVAALENGANGGAAPMEVAAAPVAPVAMEEVAPPNSILLAQRMPEECNADMLRVLFKQ